VEWSREMVLNLGLLSLAQETKDSQLFALILGTFACWMLMKESGVVSAEDVIGVIPKDDMNASFLKIFKQFAKKERKRNANNNA
jgi:hypothetical protein